MIWGLFGGRGFSGVGRSPRPNFDFSWFVTYKSHMVEVQSHEEFDKWLTALRDLEARRRINARVIRIRNGLFGDVKAVGDGLSEIRIDYGQGYRLYFTMRDRTVVLLLCGGDKNSQSRDIARAKSLASEE